MKPDHVRIIKPFLLPLIGGFALLGLVIWLKPSIWIIAGFVSALTIWGSLRSGGNLPRNLFINLGFLFGVWLLWKLFGGWGFGGLILFCLFLGGAIIYRRRKVFMSTIREIEKLIWGKTNDRKR